MPTCLPAALLEITTPLISKVWEHELATHPDQSFASYGIKRGFRVGYDHTRTQANNMASAIEHPDVVPTAGGVAEPHGGHSSHTSSIAT